MVREESKHADGISEASASAWWRSPVLTHRLMALALLSSSLVVAGFGVHSITKGSDRLLYRDLLEEDAAIAVERLQEAGLAARLGASGRAVWVGSDDVEKSRLLLASDGLPNSGTVGFELFDETTLGMTDFREQVNYRRALQGELARTIQHLGEVRQARVHLVLPRESVYSDETEPAKASVVLMLQDGEPLPAEKIASIVHLVSSAVEGLTPERVVVVDSSGSTLRNRVKPSESAAHGTTQWWFKARLEKELVHKAVAILEPALGSGRVQVKASVELSPALPPDRAASSDEDEPTEKGGGSAPTESAVAESFLARVERRSVAVLVDDALVDAVPGSDQRPGASHRPRSAEELEKYRQLVAAALGLNLPSGDVVTVENVAFDKHSSDVSSREPDWLNAFRPVASFLARYLAPLTLLLLFYVFLFRPVLNLLKRQAVQPHGRMAGEIELEDSVRGEIDGGHGEQRVGNESDPLTRARRASADEPEVVSRLVRAWLSEDRS